MPNLSLQSQHACTILFDIRCQNAAHDRTLYLNFFFETTNSYLKSEASKTDASNRDTALYARSKALKYKTKLSPQSYKKRRPTCERIHTKRKFQKDEKNLFRTFQSSEI